MALRKVSTPTLRKQVGILTLRRAQNHSRILAQNIYMWKSEDGLFTTFMPWNSDGQLKFKEQQITKNSNLLDYLDQINTQKFLFLCLLCNVMYAAMFF